MEVVKKRHWMQRVELLVSRLNKEKVQGQYKDFLRGCLTLMSHLFASGVRLRNICYRFKLFRSTKAPLPVVSIGNIACGGTGKTMFCQLLTKNLEMDKGIALLSRGYRSELARQKGVTNISDGFGAIFSPSVCGDEPYMMATRFPQHAVIVGKKREISTQVARDIGCKVVILDDGMQYRRIVRDLEVVMLDVNHEWDADFFLPRGRLRDEPRRLSDADYVIVHPVSSEEKYNDMQEKVRAYTEAPVIGTDLQIRTDLSGKKVAIFCGIGNPDTFRDSVRAAGGEIIDECILADHAAISHKELENFAKTSQSRGAELLVCTEKDRVKIKTMSGYSLPIVHLDVEMVVKFGNNYFLRLLAQTKSLIR